jgi:very-short-patch-repair endonuclease
VVYESSNSKFCSRKCRGEYSKKTSGSIRKCIVCQNDFYAKGNPKDRHICSRKCRDELKKSGKIIKCKNCGKEVYKDLGAIKRSKNLFCGVECANQFQKCEKIKFVCELCNKEFEKYPSEIKIAKSLGKKIRFCSIKCRDNDPRRFERLIRMNLSQNKNKEPNKLEKRDFIEQHLINDRICVDVYIPKSNLIIEWWGDYWHGYNEIEPEKRQKRRMNLDISQRKYLEKCGYKVLSFWEHEVYKEPDKVIEKISYNL